MAPDKAAFMSMIILYQSFGKLTQCTRMEYALEYISTNLPEMSWWPKHEKKNRTRASSPPSMYFSLFISPKISKNSGGERCYFNRVFSQWKMGHIMKCCSQRRGGGNALTVPGITIPGALSMHGGRTTLSYDHFMIVCNQVLNLKTPEFILISQ